MPISYRLFVLQYCSLAVCVCIAVSAVSNLSRNNTFNLCLLAAGKSWKKLTHSQRTPYDKMASDEKHKYIIAMKEFNAVSHRKQFAIQKYDLY